MKEVLHAPNSLIQELYLSSDVDEVGGFGKKGWGKALDISTKIPTPNGWALMGDLKVGDLVYSETGLPVRVTAAFEVMIGRPCYDVLFSDGSRLVADEEHEWHTLTGRDRDLQSNRRASFQLKRHQKNNRKSFRPRKVAAITGDVRTTKQILETIFDGERLNHSIETCGALHSVETELPIHPYLLGAWLGDGTSREGAITTADAAMIQEFVSLGEQCTKSKSAKYGYLVKGLTTRLRENGLLNNKHIPPAYLRSSVSQRVDLLQGLMDTDGYSEPAKLEFTTTSFSLMTGFVELVRTLGIKPSIVEGRAKLYEKDCGPKWRIGFTSNFPAFRLKRKLKKQKLSGFRPTTTRRYIVAINPVKSVPVRCISVDSPTHLYLAGESMICTHNSWAVNHAVMPYVESSGFSSVVFRRTSQDFADLWEKAKLHYAGFNCRIREDLHTITFPSGARRKFSHLQHIKDVFTHNGQEYQDIEFDELPQFPMMPYQFMFSCLRNGSDPLLVPRMRATGNFFGEGVYWVKARFYDQLRPTIVKDGEIIRGDIGWFKTSNNRDIRAPKDIEKALFELCLEKDWRFIKSKDKLLADWLSREWYFGERADNIDLMKNDPGYESRLEQLPEAMKKAYKYGLPQDESLPDQLFMTEWVDAALTGKNDFKPGVHSFGLDYAETGDNTVWVKGRGNQVYNITDLPYTPHPAMAELLRVFIRENGIYQIKGGIDTVGTGAGVLTSLQSTDSEASARCNPIRHHDENLKKAYESNATSILFKHLQYQILWKLRLDLQFGRIDLSPLNSTENFYEAVPELREELLSFRTRDKDGGIWISSSDDLRKAQWPDGTPCLGRSPDRVKALAIWNYVRDWIPKSFRDESRADDYGKRVFTVNRPSRYKKVHGVNREANANV